MKCIIKKYKLGKLPNFQILSNGTQTIVLEAKTLKHSNPVYLKQEKEITKCLITY
jgi:hypothetical protein